ncbi:GIY-YIG nuclease family protein [Sphaerotilaceae bacterium SBD11-9]
MSFFTYMLHCVDHSYYVGHTDDLEKRIAEHNEGSYPGYTRHRKPVTVVWSQEFASRDEAWAAERQIKGWARAKKEALIQGDWKTLQQHAWGSHNPLPNRLA